MATAMAGVQKAGCRLFQLPTVFTFIGTLDDDSWFPQDDAVCLGHDGRRDEATHAVPSCCSNTPFRERSYASAKPEPTFADDAAVEFDGDVPEEYIPMATSGRPRTILSKVPPVSIREAEIVAIAAPDTVATADEKPACTLREESIVFRSSSEKSITECTASRSRIQAVSLEDAIQRAVRSILKEDQSSVLFSRHELESHAVTGGTGILFTGGHEVPRTLAFPLRTEERRFQADCSCLTGPVALVLGGFTHAVSSSPFNAGQQQTCRHREEWGRCNMCQQPFHAPRSLSLPLDLHAPHKVQPKSKLPHIRSTSHDPWRDSLAADDTDPATEPIVPCI